MKPRHPSCVFLALLLAAVGTVSQAANPELGGSVSAIHASAHDDVFLSWTRFNKLHGRLHADWRPGGAWRFYGSMQYRVFQGEWQEKYPGFPFLAHPPNDYLKLSYTLTERNNLFAQGRMDQAYIEYAHGKLALRAGRQRIDVGQTLVWNVSDIFNNMSFFELDPLEAGSCDALRVSVFPDALSALEAIVKMDGDKQLTGAVLSRFNLKATDVHLMIGIVRQEDYFFGAGSAFSIKGLNIRSDLAYHKPMQPGVDDHPALLISFGLDYLFANQMMVQGEVLYMDNDDFDTSVHFMDLFASPYSPKSLSVSQWSYVANWHYTHSPKMSMRFTLAHFPDHRGVLLSPTLDFLPIRDLGLALTGTYFSVDRQGIQNEFWLASVRLTYYF